MRTDGWADITKLIVAFRTFTKAPYKEIVVSWYLSIPYSFLSLQIPSSKCYMEPTSTQRVHEFTHQI
jgi:hypothetical protein